MARITAIEKQRRRPRADVYLDGELGPSLRLDVIAAAGLAPGADLDERRLADLGAENERLDAIETALRLLAVRPRSTRDLRDRLRRRGLHAPAIKAALQRMQELGYLDDAAFARSWVETRQAAMPRSRRALAFELGQRGVSREVSQAVTLPLSDEEAAWEAAQRRLRQLRSLDHVTFSRRLGSFLASRGFSYGVARGVIDRCWSELAEEQSREG